MPIQMKHFGKLDGREVSSFIMENGYGIRVKLINYGARITELYTPDRLGKQASIVTGFDTLEQYVKSQSYFGCTIGRVANRIARGRFALDDRTYQLPLNNGRNTLHGGAVGFDRAVWEADTLTDSTVIFRHLSPDGDQGFPGRLKASVQFSLNPKNELWITYEAESDQPTPVNLTNHAYFNLLGAGVGNVLNHELTLAADAYTPTDAELIPTGEIRFVAGTPCDFRKSKKIGAEIGKADGYDHNFVVSAGKGEVAAKLHAPETGRLLEIITSQPGIQLYTANHFDGSEEGLGGRYQKHGAVCLETQHFPDSMNHSNFPGTLIRPGEFYRHSTCFRFSNSGS